MYGEEFTTVDGFVNVHQSLEEMMTFVANEPSVGLYFVQHHARDAMPNLLQLKDKLADTTRHTTLHTQDLEDSIQALRSMTDCGVPIAHDMIKDINTSLRLISISAGPHRGLIKNPGWGSSIRPSSSQASPLLKHGPRGISQTEQTSQSYLSSVFKSTKQKAANLRWSQVDLTSKHNEFEDPGLSATPLTSVSLGDRPCFPHTMTEEVPVSSHIGECPFEEENSTGSSVTHDLSSMTESYKLFTSEREAELEKWLEEFDENPKAS